MLSMEQGKHSTWGFRKHKLLLLWGRRPPLSAERWLWGCPRGVPRSAQPSLACWDTFISPKVSATGGGGWHRHLLSCSFTGDLLCPYTQQPHHLEPCTLPPWGALLPLDQGWDFDSGVAPHLETSFPPRRSLKPGCSRAETRLCFCCLFPLRQLFYQLFTLLFCSF